MLVVLSVECFLYHSCLYCYVSDCSTERVKHTCVPLPMGDAYNVVVRTKKRRRL